MLLLPFTDGVSDLVLFSIHYFCESRSRRFQVSSRSRRVQVSVTS